MYITHIDRLLVPMLPFLPVLTVGDYQKYLNSAQSTKWYAKIIINSELLCEKRTSTQQYLPGALIQHRDHAAFRNNLPLSMFVYSMHHLIFSHRSNK